MRDPSLHIKLSDLTKVLADICQYSKEEAEELASEILFRGKKYSPTSRKILSQAGKTSKTTKLLQSSTENAMLFSKILYMTRTTMKHRGISMINQTMKEWPFIKESTELAVNFCNDFQLEIDKGFKVYLGIALKKMANKVSLNRLASLHQSIIDTYEAEIEVKNDPNTELTKELFDEFNDKLDRSMGLNYRDHAKYLDKYIHFVKAAALCREYNISPKHFINSQFEFFEGLSTYPEPYQLYTDKAGDRVKKYIFKNKDQLSKAKTQSVDLTFLKKVK